MQCKSFAVEPKTLITISRTHAKSRGNTFIVYSSMIRIRLRCFTFFECPRSPTEGEE